VPALSKAFYRGILAHRRQEQAVGKHERSQLERRIQSSRDIHRKKSTKLSIMSIATRPVRWYFQEMDSTPEHRDLASWAYYVSFASLGMGLPIPFLSLIAGATYHGIQAKKSPFIAFHSWQALLIGLPASLVVGVWSFQGLGYSFEYFLSAGHLTTDLTGFWILGAVSAVFLALEVILGLRGAAAAKNGLLVGFGPLGRLCERLAAWQTIQKT